VIDPTQTGNLCAVKEREARRSPVVDEGILDLAWTIGAVPVMERLSEPGRKEGRYQFLRS
jgi:hypothetical protein